MQIEKNFIGGNWVNSRSEETIAVVNPAIDQVIGMVPEGCAADVHAAVAAAVDAQREFRRTTPAERLALLRRILECYRDRAEEIAQIICDEVGTPLLPSRNGQAFLGIAHLEKVIEVMPAYPFEQLHGTTLVMRDPIGVSGLITPWNVPINQIATKAYPALAAGCTMVLKPPEVAPLNARIFAEVLHEAGVPTGVFNMVHGAGPIVGAELTRHPDVRIVSFTGSTRAGIEIARAAAGTVKRVTQELGGKSANILLEDCDFQTAVRKGVLSCFNNAGQACSSPTRMLVPADRLDEVCEFAAAAAASLHVGDPRDEATTLGPVVSAAQYERVQSMIETGIREGARLVAGGLGKPESLSPPFDRGFFVRPTVFADVQPGMTIAQHEIFGPVLSILTYRDVEEAIEIANGTVYGLAAYVQSADIGWARSVARRLEAGRVHINYPELDRLAPFGGFKQSGNGRENGKYGIDEFTELKALIGHGRDPDA